MSKQLGEMCVRASTLPFAVFRLFNVYGPGEPPGRYRNAIPNMFHALNGTSAKLRIFGEEATRDFTYVEDVVGFLVQAERARGEVTNVGTGTETRIVDLAAAILSMRGRADGQLVLEAPRAWDRVTRRSADVTRLRRLYGRVAETALKDGLARTHAWLFARGHIRKDLT
jgi:nucleoside-diphosphate-sugar epimerase